MEPIQTQPQPVAAKFTLHTRSIVTILGLILVSLAGLGVTYYSYTLLSLSETASTSERTVFLLIALTVLAFLGFPWVIFRKIIISISIKRCIYEWTFLLIGGVFGILYFSLFLDRAFENIPNIFAVFLFELLDNFDLLSSTLYILLFMSPFAYLGNYLARTTREGWIKGNLKIFLRPESIIVLFVLVLYVVIPVSVNQLRITATQTTLSQITLSNFQESLLPDPESKVKKLIITADLSTPESGIYQFNNNINNKEISENYKGQFRLDYAYMAIDDEEIKSTTNFIYSDLQAGVHKITFEKSFKNLFDIGVKPTLFQEIVPDRNLYMQVRIWKGNRREDNPFFVYVYRTNKYNLDDFTQ